MFYYVYVLENQKRDLYIGYSKDLKKRVEEHNRGLSRSTKTDKPWHCIYFEACLNEKDAKRREKYLKTNQGSRMLKRRLKEYLYSRR